MEKITAPYNFVPLNKYVYCPDWADQVSQDIPFSDGEDGYIEVTWRNVSPLCIRDASAGKDGYSMHIMQPDGSRLYFLPGSSLRGMLRNTLNIMSFGKMEQYDNRFFGHREFDTKKPQGKKYQDEMAKALVGWLHKDEQKDDKYVLYPCDGKFEKIRIEEVSKLYPGYEDKQSSWERNAYIQRKSGEYFPIIWEGLRLFATGQMRNAKNPQKGKLHELLIPQPNCGEERQIHLNEDVVRELFTVYEPSPDFDEFKKLLDSGTDIPVSYIKEGENVKAVGLGRMFRYPYKHSVKSLVENEQPHESKLDLCETIFGRIDKNDSVKSRVQIGNAFAAKPICIEECAKVSGVLGTPKPSFYPLYLKQTGNSYETYDDGSGIAGRKLYRTHKGNSVVALPQGNGNPKTMTHFIPIPAGQEFKMRINVHNLRKVEIGALLSAITLYENRGVFHNIGSAKGYGYGKLECVNLSHPLLKYSTEEYLKRFEYEMTVWAKEEWSKTEPLQYLLAIASEHEDGCLRMMEMDKEKSPIGKNEYDFYSKNTNFSKLTEPLIVSRSFLTEEDRSRFEEERREQENKQRLRQKAEMKLKFRDEHKARYDEVDRQEKEENHAKALQILNPLISDLLNRGLDTEEENTWLRKIEHLQDVVEKEAQEAQEEERKKEKAEMLDKGLAYFLDEKCKERTWRMCEDRLDKKWLKAKGITSLSEEELPLLENTIRRLHASPDKKESKEWTKPFEQSKIWSQIAKYLGDEHAQNLYKELVK